MMLDVTDRLIVIVGGGAVAVRKVEGLLAAGATRVRVIAPAFADDMPNAVERIAETYQARHLDGAGLVFAATDDPEVNAAVGRDARSRGLLANRSDAADDAGAGDFSTPAVWRGGAMTITVATSGSPALAARVRDDLSAKIDNKFLLMAEALQTLRPLVLGAANLDESRRREIFRRLVAPQALAVLSDEGLAGLERWLAGEYAELRGLGNG